MLRPSKLKKKYRTPPERRAILDRQAEIGEQLYRQTVEIRQDALLRVLEDVAETVKGWQR
ncbi:hypothetical protein AB4Z42_17075 [Mycobacterium sp. 2YAF39]|uniref:hypothetical protein n=1 Tax=Mycobacterium sp. 2YAF39 TaxID=3233033 RepID=UPI003F9966B9